MKPALRSGFHRVGVASPQGRLIGIALATMVTFHAHPDDEAISTGGTMRLAADAGHRVVLVVATQGEVGEVADGFLRDGESLSERRVAETHAAAEILGVARVVFLGFRDSGMMGEPSNEHPEAFWQADVEAAAHRLASILREENADVLTIYDRNGGYGHPDHIQVHRVGHRAGSLAGTKRVYEATLNRDEVRRMMTRAREAGIEVGPDDEDAVSFDALGTPDAEISTAVDVELAIEHKRSAMRAHASQIDETSWFLTLPDDAFRMTFGTEWFVRVVPAGVPSPRERSIFGED